MRLFQLMRTAVAAGVVAVLTASCSLNSSDEIVISYNSPDQWANWGAVLEAFTEETDIEAPSDDKNSGKTIAALVAEQASPAADTAYYGIVFGMQAAEQGLVAPYQNDKLAEIPGGLKAPDGTWFAVHQGAIAFLVNTEAIGDAPVPQCWSDLTKPEYAGMVSFLDPATAAVGQSVMTAANLALGGSYDNWEPGLSWAKQLRENGDLKLPTETATNQLEQGEIPILIDADFNGYQSAQAHGAPVEVVLPCEGTISTPYVMSLVKGAPHEENAKKFLDFVLSDKAQTLFAESYLRPVRDVPVSDGVAQAMLPEETYDQLVKIPDFAKLKTAVTKLVEQWNAQVAG